MKSLMVAFLASALLMGCVSKYRVDPEVPLTNLQENEGYLGLVFNTLDPLKNIQIRNTETSEEFYIGRTDKGYSQITLKLTEGEYCFIGFDVYNFRVDYENQGSCTYVEAGELNYFAEFVVRDPITNTFSNYSRYVSLLKQDIPELCYAFVNEDCNV